MTRNLLLIVFGLIACSISLAASPGCNCDAHARHLGSSPTAMAEKLLK